MFSYYRFPTTQGPLVLTADSRGITGLIFEKWSPVRFNPNHHSKDFVKYQAEARAITAYLNGAKHSLKNLPWALGNIGTSFQRQVWALLMKIEVGSTRTYGEIAEVLGGKKYSRAVGGACNANPIPLLIPCHRVIDRRGRLGGFNLGPMLKQKLLQLEQVN